MKTKLLIFVIAALILASCSPAAVKTNTPVVLTNTETAVTQPTIQAPVSTVIPAAMPTIEPTAVTSQSTNTAVVSFSNDIWPVIQKIAGKAHGGKGGVFLESYDDIMKYVVPGNPEQSKIYKDITGNGTKQMPPNHPLPPETIQLFYDWIKQGAKNN